jgi:hypothetical protein
VARRRSVEFARQQERDHQRAKAYLPVPNGHIHFQRLYKCFDSML